MKISITYKRLNIFDNFDLITDSMNLTNLNQVDKFVDIVFGKFGSDQESLVEVLGLKAYWADENDFRSDIATVHIKDQVLKLSRTQLIFNIKKTIRTSLKNDGYATEFK